MEGCFRSVGARCRIPISGSIGPAGATIPGLSFAGFHATVPSDIQNRRLKLMRDSAVDVADAAQALRCLFASATARAMDEGNEALYPWARSDEPPVSASIIPTRVSTGP